MPFRWWKGTSRVTRSPAKSLNDARRTTALAERRAEPEGCGSLEDISVCTTRGGSWSQRSRRPPNRDDNETILNKNHATTPTRRTSNQLLHTIHSHLTFTAPIHSTYSQHSFTPDVHTGTTDHDSSTATARRHDGSTARRRTQPEKCGGNHQRANHQRAYGPTGLRTNGSADAHRVLGADRESQSLMHE